VDQNAIA